MRTFVVVAIFLLAGCDNGHSAVNSRGDTEREEFIARLDHIMPAIEKGEMCSRQNRGLRDVIMAMNDRDDRLYCLSNWADRVMNADLSIHRKMSNYLVSFDELEWHMKSIAWLMGRETMMKSESYIIRIKWCEWLQKEADRTSIYKDEVLEEVYNGPQDPGRWGIHGYASSWRRSNLQRIKQWIVLDDKSGEFQPAERKRLSDEYKRVAGEEIKELCQ